MALQKNWKISAATHKRLKILCAHEEISGEEAAVRALDALELLSRQTTLAGRQVPMGESISTKGDTSKNEDRHKIDMESRPHRLLAAILAEAPALVQDALRANLEAFALMVGVKSGEEIGERAADAAAPAGNDTAGIIARAEETLRSLTRGPKGPGGAGERSPKRPRPRRAG